MDAIEGGRFANSIAAEHRPSHEVLRHYAFYANSSVDRRLDLLRVAKPLEVSAGGMLYEAGNPCRDVAELRALAIPATVFRKISRRNAALRDYTMSVMVLRFAEIIGLVREITTRRVGHRLAEYLLGKFDESDEQPPVAAVTQQQIALDLGTVREVVSRRLQEMDSIGAVEVQRGRVVQLDRVALHRFLA